MGNLSGSNVGMQVVNQILVEMDGVEDRKGVIIVASTNRPDILDPALLRPGRFDRIVYVHPPNKKGREKILEVHTKDMPLSEEVKLKMSDFAEQSDGYSGADLENVVREAGMQAIREKLEDFDYVELSHFEYAFKKIPPSLTPKLIQKYNEIADKLSQQKIRTVASLKDPGLFT